MPPITVGRSGRSKAPLPATPSPSDDPSHARTIRDAYGHPIVHQPDEDYPLIRLTNPLGYTDRWWRWPTAWAAA
ncbi:MAG: hypothetical protein J7452_09780 [Thermoflexus sp.]|jgi:hypothetical protein|nr:hypothetical protein [Thermoflexus sp.]